MRRWMVTWGLLLLFAAVGAADEHDGGDAARADDAPAKIEPPEAREGFTFLAYGDRTGGRPAGLKILERAVEVTNKLDPDFVMTVGDLVNGYNKPDAWLKQTAAYKDVMNRLNMPWYPVAGNHDVYGGRSNPKGNAALYEKHFGPLYYSFDYRWAHFVCLYTDESLSFANPKSKTQNMSKAQMDWLRDDLASTNAKQIYLFMHHPRWLYAGCNWPAVHEILKNDGRVRAVFAGHIHTLRDDGVKDGVHYFVLGATGATQNKLAETIGIHHLTHVRVRPDGFSASHVALGSVLGSDAVLGREANELWALRNGTWLSLSGDVDQRIGETTEQTARVKFVNPTGRDVLMDVELALPKGWTATPSTYGARVAAGATHEQKIKLVAPKWAGKRATITLKGTAYYPFKSGITQPIHHTQKVVAGVTDVPRAFTKSRSSNAALALDGASAARVPADALADLGDEFTVECWVKGESPSGTRAVIANNEQSSFGIWWCDGPRRVPHGVCGLAPKPGARGKYHYAVPETGWVYEVWTHVALVYDGKRLRFFVNGKIAAEIQVAGVPTRNRFSMYIGADPTRTDGARGFFKGMIDEVRVSNTVRYKRAFKPKRVHERDKFTLALLHFDIPETLASRAVSVFWDDSGNDHHAWPVGNPTLEPADR